MRANSRSAWMLLVVWLVTLLTGLPLLLDRVAAAERIVIGTPSRGLFEFPAVVAMRKGFYKEEGLETDKVQMQPAIAVKALISGDIDYLLAWGSSIRAAVTGVPIKAVIGMASRPLHVLIARPDIKSPKELKGKIIGVDSVAGTVDYLSRVAIRHFGMEPGRDDSNAVRLPENYADAIGEGLRRLHPFFHRRWFYIGQGGQRGCATHQG